jgi:hypothetical protein
MTEATPTPALRKGQKVWLVGMDRTGLYEVVPAAYVQTSDSGQTIFVRITIEYEGKAEKIVVDRRAGDIHLTRRDAVMAAVAKCQDLARRNTERADELLASLAK